MIGYKRLLCNGYGFVFLSYDVVYVLIPVMPSVNGYAELPATLISEFGCHIGINCMRLWV